MSKRCYDWLATNNLSAHILRVEGKFKIFLVFQGCLYFALSHDVRELTAVPCWVCANVRNSYEKKRTSLLRLSHGVNTLPLVFIALLFAVETHQLDTSSCLYGVGHP